jgi:riboflavin synthase
MFTGLIADIGTVAAIDRSARGARLRVESTLGAELAEGDSIAVSGVCLTALAPAAEQFEADLMNQTLSLTSLAGIAAGDRVNLEPALRASDRLGGHIVQGHVDGVARVADVAADGFAKRIELTLPEALRPYVVEHGSIAVDGVSLTVARIEGNATEVSLIPETLERTTLGARGIGETVNIEVDLLARYAERLLQGLAERRSDEDV